MVAAFTCERVIEFVETDAAGIVHHSNFFRFMESAESAWLRQLGCELHDPTSDYAWPRVRVACSFARPARFGETLHTRLYVARLGRSSIDYVFDFTMDELPVARGGYTVVHTRVDRANGRRRAQPLPEALRAQLRGLVDASVEQPL